MKERSIASVIIWITYIALVWFTIDPLGLWSIMMAFVLMIPLAIMMGLMWGMIPGDKQGEQRSKDHANIEKRKRERLDAVLRDLSDAQLLRLRQRLADGAIDDDVLQDLIVGDDGELSLRD